MPPSTPYSRHLGDRDPIEALRHTLARIQTLASGWSAADFEGSYAPGKWTTRQVLVHLVHMELAIGTRARMALTQPGYVAQPFEQDLWMTREGPLTGTEALAAFVATAGMNLRLFESLSPADRHVPFSHPEFGPITVDWIIHMMAGHQLNHLNQLEQIVAGS